jgi:methyl-accepting chemotaxis protein
MGFLLDSIFQKEITKIALESAWNLSNEYGNYIKGSMDVTVTALSSMSDKATTFQGTEGAADAQEYLEKILKENSFLQGVWIAYEPDVLFDGEFAPALYLDGETVRSLHGFNYKDERYVAPSKSGNIFISEPITQAYGDTVAKIVSLTIPFKDSSGKHAGVAGVDVSLEKMSGILSKIKPYDVGYAFILTNQQTMLAHPTPSTLGKPSAVAQELKPFAEKRQQYLVERLATATGIYSYTFYSPIILDRVDYAYYIGVSVPKQAVLSVLTTIRLVVIITALCAIILVSAIVISILGKLVKTLGAEPAALVDAIKTVSTGDFTIGFDIAKGDTNSVAYHMKIMVGDLSKLLNNTFVLLSTLKSVTSGLAGSVNILSSEMLEQTNRSTQISSASKQTSTSTAEIADNISEIASFSSQTAETASKGKNTVTSSVEKISIIKNTVDSASSLVNRLGEKSNEIKNIVAVITNIADQTNLLALNAAIEAARAGESGRGFAVVADEVRKLAENTQKSTSEIADLISSNQKEIENVMRSMQEVIAQVNAGVDSSRNTTSMLDEIERGITQLHNMLFNISTATQQVSVASNLILNDISSVADISSRVKNTANNLETNVSELEKVSSDLEEKMSKFKIHETA